MTGDNCAIGILKKVHHAISRGFFNLQGQLQLLLGVAVHCATTCTEDAQELLLVQVDPATGEIAGVFESIQPSDTDLGSKAPKDVKITGLWYGQLS